MHRSDCPNVASLLTDGTRMIDVEWGNTAGLLYHVELEVTAQDRHGLVNECMNAVAETKTEITAVSARADSQRIAHINLSVNIRNIEHLRSVVERLKRLKDILTVRRLVQ